MKVLTNLATFFFLFRFSNFWVSAAVIDSQARSYALSPLAEREVTYGVSSSDATKSAVCNEGQRTILEQGMRDTVRLAKAGADGLAVILDMLTEEKTAFNKLNETERHRYQETYYTFFGRAEDKNRWPLLRKRASFIKASLDRLSALTVETWPKNITLYCDSSYFQNKDNDGRTSDQVPLLQKTVLKPGLKFLFDTDFNQWSGVSPVVNCSDSNGRVEAYTSRGTRLDSNGVVERRDRITFCPVYFSAFKVPTTGQSVPTPSVIQPGLSLRAFSRKAGRTYVFFFSSSFFGGTSSSSAAPKYSNTVAGFYMSICTHIPSNKRMTTIFAVSFFSSFLLSMLQLLQFFSPEMRKALR